MADDGFVMAVDPQGNKRRVPEHYLENPAFGFKLPPSARVEEPAEWSGPETVREPAGALTGERVEEPAAPATPKTSKRAGAAGEKQEA